MLYEEHFHKDIVSCFHRQATSIHWLSFFISKLKIFHLFLRVEVKTCMMTSFVISTKEVKVKRSDKSLYK